MPEPSPSVCSRTGCTRVGRWPVMPRGRTYCDACLVEMVAACGATAVRLGDSPSDVFRTRHDACGALIDVTLTMIRRGGWVCRWCKLTADQTSAPVYVGRILDPCTVEEQERVMAGAGMRPMLPLRDERWGDPLNVECLDCGAAQVESLHGLSEGVRLSWLPCQRCNAQRFAVTHAKVSARFDRLGMQLLSEWTGDASAHLTAQCKRCGLTRTISWLSLGSGSPPCLACDREALDPDEPHRVYLVDFRQFGPVGAYKVGITHTVHDRRLRDHEDAGGRVMFTVTVPNRASALTVERRVLAKYVPGAPADLPRAALPRGGHTECWDASAGYPDLAAEADEAGVRVLARRP